MSVLKPQAFYVLYMYYSILLMPYLALYFTRNFCETDYSNFVTGKREHIINTKPKFIVISINVLAVQIDYYRKSLLIAWVYFQSRQRSQHQ